MRESRNAVPRIVFLTVFIDLLGFGIVIPLLPLYAERYGPTPLQFGLLMSSYSAMQFLFAPILGRLSDRVGRRPVLLVSLFGTVVGYLIFAFAHSLAALFVSRILDGITGGNIGTAHAVIADSTSQDERARGMGMVGMAFGLGFIFGPAIGGFTVRIHDWAPGLTAAALSFTAFVWAYFRLPETLPPDAAAHPFRVISARALLDSLRRPTVGLLLVLMFLTTTAFANFEATFSQFLHHRFGSEPHTVAWLFVVLGVTAALVQGGLVRVLVPRLGEPRLILAGMSLLGLGFVALIFSRGMPMLLLAIVLMAFGSGLTNPSLSSLVSKKTAADEQGAVLGSLQSMGSMARIAGPLWGEKVFFRFGPAGPYTTGAVVEALAVALSGFLLSRDNGRGRPAPEVPS